MRYPGTKQGAAPRVTTADEWRSKKRKAARGMAVPLPLPTGVTVMISRPPIETWFGTAKLPEALSRNVAHVFDVSMDDPEAKAKMEARLKALTEQENADIIRFMNRLLLEGVVQPMLVDKDPDECSPEEMALSDLDEEERAHILYFLMEGVPTQPVKTASDGEVSMEALHSFPEEGRGAGTGEGGGEVRDNPQRDDGAAVSGAQL